jgi:hypothetical protein
MRLIEELPHEWFDVEAAKGVAVRHRHPGCSDGKDQALTVIRRSDGWYVHCFRCGKSDFKSTDNLSPDQVLRWKREPEVENEQTAQVKLPYDYSSKVSRIGLAWLFACGVTQPEIDQYKIGYSVSKDRVILPVYENGELVYWQGRYLGDDPKRPKYINQAKAGRRDIYFKVVHDRFDKVVIVEDILSSINVGRVRDCYALLSAHVPDRLVFDLAERYKRILLWLDYDKGEKMGQWCLRYRSFGLSVSFLHTDKDPKYYSEKEIEELTGG